MSILSNAHYVVKIDIRFFFKKISNNNFIQNGLLHAKRYKVVKIFTKRTKKIIYMKKESL